MVIAGNDDEGLVPILRRQAAKRGVSARVQFLDRMITGMDKEALFAQAACLALPSLSENFGLVVLEAMIPQSPGWLGGALGRLGDLGPKVWGNKGKTGEPGDYHLGPPGKPLAGYWAPGPGWTWIISSELASKKTGGAKGH